MLHKICSDVPNHGGICYFCSHMEILQKYFPSLTQVQTERFQRAAELYPQWNARINVVSRKDIDNIVEHHVLHSLAIAKFLTPVDGSAFLDMGTGGGFPGIPLAIMWPHCRFHLVDRIGKKLKVASEIASALGLDNVTFQHGDIGECRERYDFVLSRAVMRLEALVPLVRKNVSRTQRNGFPNGLICLKGGDLSDEIKATRLPVLEVPLSDYFSEDYFREKELVYVEL